MDIKKLIIQQTDSLRQSMQVMDLTSKKVLFVVDKSNRLIGSLSDGDIRRWILSNGNIDDQVSNIMNKNPIILARRDDIQAKKIMNKQGITAIPIVNEDNSIIDICFWTEDQGNSIYSPIDAKVVIMAGGKGERLLPYTSIVPKPLIPIGEKPIVEHVINSFKKYGCKDFLLTINYKKNMIKAYFDEQDRNYHLQYIEEDEPLGTGGSLSLLKEDLNSTFFVSNCDILVDADYADILHFHKQSGNLITVITSLKKYIVPYGVISLNSNGGVCSLTEKPSIDYLVNTGVYVLEPEALNFLVKNTFIHITGLIEHCLNDGKRIGAYPISEDSWMDMGQFEDMDRMKAHLERLEI